MFAETEAVGLGQDNVVGQGNAQKLTGGGELLGQGNVLLAGARVAGGVVVGDYYACSTVGNGVGKDFARVGQHRIERPDGDGALGDKPLAAIE